MYICDNIPQDLDHYQNLTDCSLSHNFMETTNSFFAITH